MPQTLIKKKNCDENSQSVEGWWARQRVPKMKMLMLSLEHLCKRNLQTSETFFINSDSLDFKLLLHQLSLTRYVNFGTFLKALLALPPRLY